MPGEVGGGPTPTATIHAHAGIEDAIDRAFIGAVVNSARARTYMHSPQGPIRDVFLNFYTPFVALVEYTYQLETLKLEKEGTLQEALLTWIDSGPGHQSAPDKIWIQLELGLRLFRDYKALLMRRGVISVHRR